MLSSENFDAHKCDLSLKECKTIEVVKIIDGSYEDRQLMNGWGTDGILYTFEIMPRKAIPIMMPLKQTKVYMDSKTAEDFTEPSTNDSAGFFKTFE